MIEPRLIVALDVPDTDVADNIVGDLHGLVNHWKIGGHLLFDSRLWLQVEWFIKNDHKVLADFKLNDIPSTMRAAVEGAARLGVDGVTVRGDVAQMQAALEGQQDGKPAVYCVPRLSSEAFGALSKGFRLSGDGMIATAQYLPAIRTRPSYRPEYTILCPAIRPMWYVSEPGGDFIGDHVQSSTPAEAIKAGADYLIVGRPIMQADDPRAAAQRIIDEMRAAT